MAGNVNAAEPSHHRRLLSKSPLEKEWTFRGQSHVPVCLFYLQGAPCKSSYKLQQLSLYLFNISDVWNLNTKINIMFLKMCFSVRFGVYFNSSIPRTSPRACLLVPRGGRYAVRNIFTSRVTSKKNLFPITSTKSHGKLKQPSCIQFQLQLHYIREELVGAVPLIWSLRVQVADIFQKPFKQKLSFSGRY